ncbi:hypothetical protein [Paraburkholderia fungorum]
MARCKPRKRFPCASATWDRMILITGSHRQECIVKNASGEQV